MGDTQVPSLSNLPKIEFAVSVTYCLRSRNYNGLKKKKKVKCQGKSVNFRSFFFSLDNENKMSAF